MKSNFIESVVVIGLGYIGLPTAAVLASRGVSVIGVDVNKHAVDTINRGEIHIVEPDLDVAVAKAVKNGTLKAQTTTPHATNYIVAVPTPFKDGNEPDLTYIEAAADGIAPMLKGGELIILESTSPPGATEYMADRIITARPDLAWRDSDSEENQIYIAHCPERVLPGKIMEEMVSNDRIVGGLTDKGAAKAIELYKTFCQGKLLATDAKTAEMTKLVENSFRDVNIAFANELSIISSKIGIDVWELIDLANHHPRVNILQPGPGVGGHCIAVDPWFIVAADPENSTLIRSARERNDSKPAFVLQQVDEALRSSVTPVKQIALMGLAFKPDIDDLRESPALMIAEELVNKYEDIQFDIYEPNIEKLPNSFQKTGNATLALLSNGVITADLVIILVDHTQFKQVIKVKDNAIVIDTKNVSKFWKRK